jgi:hypothetical protein
MPAIQSNVRKVDDLPREQYLVHIPYAAAALSYYVCILVIRRARLSSRFEEIGREAPRSSNKMFAKGERAQVLIMILAVCVCVCACISAATSAIMASVRQSEDHTRRWCVCAP